MIGTDWTWFMRAIKFETCQLRMGEGRFLSQSKGMVLVVYQREPSHVCKDAHFPIKTLTDETFLIYFMRFPIYAGLFNKQQLKI